MKKCRNCGFEMADNMNFCPQCHARYEAAAHRNNEAPKARNGAGGRTLTKAQRDTLVKRLQSHKFCYVFSTVLMVFAMIVLGAVVEVALLLGNPQPTKIIILLAACVVSVLMLAIYHYGKAKEIQDKLDADDR